MRTRLCLLTLLLTGACPAWANNWWWVGTSDGAPHRFNTYVESDSAQLDGKNVRVWVYTHAEAPFDNGEVSARALNEFDCRRRTSRLWSRSSYDAEGRLLNAFDYRDEPWLPIGPDTVWDGVLQTVCGNRQPRQQNIENPFLHSLNVLSDLARSRAENAGPGDERGISFGTGFFVGPAGLLLTSYHVVEAADRIACRTTDGEVWSATLLRASPANDLAVLQVDNAPEHYLGLAPPNSLRHGERVFTIGFPVVNILGLEPSFTEGTVSALSLAGEDAFVQISVPIQPGNSGGPVVTESGQVVGIVAATAAVETFYQATGAFPQNVNWAVKADYARPLLGAAPAAAPRARQAAIDLVRQSICLVVAER